MAGLISLNLDKKEPPKLQEILDIKLFAEHLKAGNIVQHLHTDKHTQMFTAKEDAPWDEVTSICQGLIIRDGKVVARPFRRMLGLNTPGFPESSIENLKPTGMLATRMVGGYLMNWYTNSQGHAFLCTRHHFFHQPSLWASSWLRRYHRAATWPTNYTPVFQVVSTLHRKVVPYAWDQAYLLGLVNNFTGEELPWSDVVSWANFNEMIHVEAVPVKLYDVCQVPMEERGLVLRWDFKGKAPLRVYIEKEEYTKIRVVLSQATPEGLWDLLRQDADLSPLKDKKILPQGFVNWVNNWENKIIARRFEIETEVHEVFGGVKFSQIPPRDMHERRDAIQFFVSQTRESKKRLAMLFALMNQQDRRLEELYWEEAKEITVGQGGWR